eukprot:CAMPEP_0196570900 /NCGR_PEP_ID=MMETSP1081-20130531/1062_1 /TAXON_ID=36882 /ORGANISM="Pyramimonas amylifera, Strain CCMP720" /LENGTH=237 /DNA_ID=CAMNT_0041887591 /DNA_START=218 /DNA_END=931 /DNA_ORIENTATION=-
MAVQSEETESDDDKVQLADRLPPVTRQDVIERIKLEAPLVTSRDVIDDRLSYKPVLKYKVGESPASYVLYTMHLKQSLPKELDAFNMQVTRTFQPDPNTVIVRWRMSWLSDTKAMVISGSTTYRLQTSSGLITSINDIWDFEGEKNNEQFFRSCFDFAQCWRPLGVPKLSEQNIPTALKFASWETLKDNELVGGQLDREELDIVTMQMFTAACGFVFIWAAFFAVFFLQLAFKFSST